jgi:hypothetical protein
MLGLMTEIRVTSAEIGRSHNPGPLQDSGVSCRVFNGAVSSSDYTASDDRMNNESGGIRKGAVVA